MGQLNEDQECCPKFNPRPWDGMSFEWEGKRFVKTHVATFFHIPLNFGQVMKKLIPKVRAAEAQCSDMVCLSDHTSKWNMDLYLAVTREVAGYENVTLSGRYLSKVYEGDFKKTGEWCGDFAAFAKGKSLDVRKMYMWYTTCPKCAKKYGKNYVVIVAEIASA